MTARATAPVQTGAVRLSTAAWAAVGFVVLYRFSVATRFGQQLDDAAMQWLAAAVTSDGWAVALLKVVSAGPMLLAGAALAVITAATRGLRTTALSTLSGGVVLLGAEVLKRTLARPGFSVQGLANSFPSGHVAAMVGLSVALLLVIPRGRWRRAALMAATSAVALTGLATVVLGWHRPSDVLGSVLLGVVVIGVVASRRDSGVVLGRWRQHPRPGRAAAGPDQGRAAQVLTPARTSLSRSARPLSQPAHSSASEPAQVGQAYWRSPPGVHQSSQGHRPVRISKLGSAWPPSTRGCRDSGGTAPRPDTST